MGTRADFYVGRGATAEWLGSIAMDGYPEGGAVEPTLTGADTEEGYRRAVEALLATDSYATRPSQGWPWPWDDSCTTDYAYAWDGDRVWGSCFGHRWFDAREPQPEEDTPKEAVFPNMKSRANVTMGPRSGLIVITG